MYASPSAPRHILAQRILFSGLVSVGLLLQVLFLANLLRWPTAPDRGWNAFRGLGPRVVGTTTPAGARAGLRPGDQILALNGTPYDTYDELNALTDFAIGRVNEYRIQRGDQVLTVRVTTAELGWRAVIMPSGLNWVLGVIFFGIGTLVFLMKPYHGPSWVFLVMTTLLGLFIPYYTPAHFYHPAWLNNVVIFTLPLIPASILHLAVLFPERKRFLADRPLLAVAPYAVALTLGGLSRWFGARIAVVPDALLTLTYLYAFDSLLAFLASTIYTYAKALAVAVRLQSLVIISGITVALVIPMIQLSSTLVFKVSLVPYPTFFYPLFLSVFPVSIGYAIARHDLFEIDVIIRRTYGYLLSTAAVVAGYAAVASALNVVFQSAELSRSPLFSIALALGIVFVFEPLHKRIQRVVDRVFYRQQYDYRKTIKNISEAMTSILDEDLIYKTLVGSVVREMFLENGFLLLPDPAGQHFQLRLVEGVEPKTGSSRQIAASDPLIRLFQETNDAVFRHDLDLHPRYEGVRESLHETFGGFESELMIPMKYKDEIRGIISLGRKKSGKMYTPEDLDLLKTIINQSVIALENAKLFRENLEKGRLEEELKIARDIQVSMLPDKAPALAGYQIAARSLPAREVGGDFYDFIEARGNATGHRLGIVIGDVSGKAVSGALVMAASRSIFRALAEAHPSVGEVMRVANDRLNRDITKGMFVAALYAVLHPRHQTVTLANAGQTQPIISRAASGKAFYVDTEGDRFPLGIVPDCDYQETEVVLEPGDTVVFYTDGLVEAMNEKDELYGFERLLTSIEDGQALSASMLLEKLIVDVSRHVGDAEQHDDLTIVVVKAQ